ncbi:MAG: hypothetical protein EA369_02270 [Bradymonadales bacterium]|nr:MAG: hypothetical protein EA369_02270 [Bradymonadales bacterium]
MANAKHRFHILIFNLAEQLLPDHHFFLGMLPAKLPMNEPLIEAFKDSRSCVEVIQLLIYVK